MADSNFTAQQPFGNAGFKEAVCINSGRIYDTCSDKDCLEDLWVDFGDAEQSIIDNSTSIKVKNVEVLKVILDVEPVPFNKGFYSVDMTFYFIVKIDATITPLSTPEKVEGVSSFTKKVILYGSEGSVNHFSSDDTSDSAIYYGDTKLPRATVSVVNPICLSGKLTDTPVSLPEVTRNYPKAISNRFNNEFCTVVPRKFVYVSIGLFSIVHLEREVQMMVPVYDFCMPDKDCTSKTDDPCEIFKKIKFPLNEFFPPKLEGCCED